MSALRNVKEGFLKVWGMGEDDEYEEEDLETATSRRSRYEVRTAEPEAEPEAEPTEEPEYERAEARTVSRTVYAPTAAARHGRPASDDDGAASSRFSAQREQPQPQSGGGRGGSGGGARGLRSVAMPLRSRDKNIYTLKPKTMDEASLAADYLKTGCAVIVNLDDVERMIAVRIIDFMSGVCYGLENQGHAMKLGDFIFLFTPGDFEITSDEVDYGENPDFIFKDMNQREEDDAKPEVEAASDEAPKIVQSSAPNSETAGERRSWER